MENKLNIPVYRATREDNGEHVIGFYLSRMLWYDSFLSEPSHTILVRTPHDILNPQNGYYYEQYFIDPTTLAIKMTKRNLFMSLDDKTGKGGDKISDNEVYFYKMEN